MEHAGTRVEVRRVEGTSLTSKFVSECWRAHHHAANEAPPPPPSHTGASSGSWRGTKRGHQSLLSDFVQFKCVEPNSPRAGSKRHYVQQGSGAETQIVARPGTLPQSMLHCGGARGGHFLAERIKNAKQFTGGAHGSDRELASLISQ